MVNNPLRRDLIPLLEETFPAHQYSIIKGMVVDATGEKFIDSQTILDMANLRLAGSRARLGRELRLDREVGHGVSIEFEDYRSELRDLGFRLVAVRVGTMVESVYWSEDGIAAVIWSDELSGKVFNGHMFYNWLPDYKTLVLDPVLYPEKGDKGSWRGRYYVGYRDIFKLGFRESVQRLRIAGTPEIEWKYKFLPAMTDPADPRNASYWATRSYKTLIELYPRMPGTVQHELREIMRNDNDHFGLQL